MIDERLEVLSWFPWNGSKRWLTPHIHDIVRDWRGGRYFEPFVGGGSVSFMMRQLTTAPHVLGDRNPWLVSAFAAQRGDVVLPEMEDLTNEWIQAQRAFTDAEFDSLSTADAAMRFAVCLLTAWGNRWEVRDTGEFRSTLNKRYCVPDYLLQRLTKFFSVNWLGDADTATAADWSKTVEDVEPGDLVYLDSPYPESLGYGTVWRFNDHLDVMDWAVDAARRGVSVVISNMGDLERLYRRAGLHTKLIQGPKRSKTRAAREEVLAWMVET